MRPSAPANPLALIYPRQAAEILGVSTAQVKELVRFGRLRCRRVFREEDSDLLLFERGDVERLRARWDAEDAQADALLDEYAQLEQVEARV